MALENYRPIQFPEKTEIDNTDVVLIDSSTNGTNKYQLSRITAEAEAKVNAAVAAEATARDAAIAAETTAREQADADLKAEINLFEDGFEFENQFVYAKLIAYDKYASISNGKIALLPLTNFNAYLLPVDGISTYTFTGCRFAFLVDSDGETAIGNLLENVTSVTSTGASYICFSFSRNTYPVASYVCSRGSTLQTGVVLPNWTSEIFDYITDNKFNLQTVAKNIGLNLFQFTELLGTNKYGTIVDGKLSLASLNSFNAYLLPVDGVSKYYFSNCRWAFLVGADKETAIGSLLESVAEVDSTGASYICFSFNYNSFPVDSYHIGITQDNPSRFLSVSGSLASGDGLSLANCKNCLRKGERIVFNGDITSFSSLKIGLSSDPNLASATLYNTFLIDGTNISYYTKSASTPNVVPHGLTIADNIQIVWEMTETASCIITLISDGQEYQHEFTNFIRQAYTLPYVLSVGSTLSDCKLTWTCTDILKGIWMFGDSYFGYATNRWTYYLHQFGYDGHVLLDGYGGEGSTPARLSFANLVKYGKPKFAVYCIGMNDATDSSSAPSSAWATGRDYFLTRCNINNIIPVFGTIPSVPNINHEQKNAWIRSSGYRYIDFAKAVGAQADGTWFTGMLEDGVHPTPQGARALCARALLDLPELMVDRFDLT